MKYRILEVTNGLGEKTWSFQKQIINSLEEIEFDKQYTITETKVVREYN